MIKPFSVDIFRYYRGIFKTKWDKYVEIPKLISCKLESIGNPYEEGFGVGVPYPFDIPEELHPYPDTYIKGSARYGNFYNNDGSVFVYIPKFWLKVDWTREPEIQVKDWDYFVDETAANAEGYILMEGFIDGGIPKGFYIFKYKASKIAKGTGYVAGSVKDGKPISTHSTHNPISDLTACAGNYYYESINAAHAIDGENGEINPNSKYFVTTNGQYAILALLTLAIPKDAQYCAWRDLSKHYPKGCNNNALSDADDTSILYVWDGYEDPPGTPKYSALTGSCNQLAKTSHNGQLCGVLDLNGNMYEIALGLTCVGSTKAITGITKANPAVVTCSGHGLTTGTIIGISGVVGMTQANDKAYKITVIDENSFSLDTVDSTAWADYTSGGTVYFGTYYAKKRSYSPKLWTPGNTGANDHWGATGVANWGEEITLNFNTTHPNNTFAQKFGNSNNAVFSNAVLGNNYKLTCNSLPLETGLSTTGTDKMGKDYYYQYVGRNELCCLRCCGWYYGSGAGVFSASLSHHRSYSASDVGFRACCFPD